jgi:hypothetical protein
MGFREFVPLEGRPGRPYIEFGARLHVERWVLPTRVVDNPREGEASKLGWQAALSCPGAIVHSGMGRHCGHRGLAPHAVAWNGVMLQCRP